MILFASHCSAVSSISLSLWSSSLIFLFVFGATVYGMAPDSRFSLFAQCVCVSTKPLSDLSLRLLLLPAPPGRFCSLNELIQILIGNIFGIWQPFSTQISVNTILFYRKHIQYWLSIFLQPALSTPGWSHKITHLGISSLEFALFVPIIDRGYFFNQKFISWIYGRYEHVACVSGSDNKKNITLELFRISSADEESRSSKSTPA